MSDDYNERFGGLGRLFGREALGRLRAARVAVVGVGGVGSWAVEGLARSGVGAITMIDLDDVCVTNVNRQLPALDGAIGRPKVAVLAERVRLINPACRVEAVSEFFTDETAARLMAPGFDVVIDAVDLMSHKARIIAAARDIGAKCVTVGSAGGRRDPGRVQTGDLGEAENDELIRQVRKKLRRDHGFGTGKMRGKTIWGVRCVWSAEPRVFPHADGSCRAEPEAGFDLKLDCEAGFGAAVFVTGIFGLAAAGEAVRLLAEPVSP